MAEIDLKQQLAQLNAHLRNINDSAGQTIHGFYKEVRRMLKAFDSHKMLGVRPASIPLHRNITSGSGGTDSMKIGSDVDFIVHEVRGYLSFNNWDGESDLAVDGLAGGWPGPRDRAYLKASNCKLKLKNKDNKLDIFEEEDLVLSEILCSVGGHPLKYGGETRPAWVIPNGTTIEMTATLQDTAAVLIGASSDYGVIISGVYMPKVS